MLLTFGLFETAADVCASVNDLVKHDVDAHSIWLVARDLEADTGEQSDRRMTIAQVIDALQLTPAARYLDTTALVVIPEEGTYLAAGWPASALTRRTSARIEEQTQLCTLLIGVGCDSAEAGFLDGRLQAGTILLGVADEDEALLERAREVFADQQAIHVGIATMPEPAGGEAPSAIPRPDDGISGDAVLLDIATLVVFGGSAAAASHEMIGHRLLDEAGMEIGPITGVAVDVQQTGERTPEYVVVSHGGFLGVGRHDHLIPIELVSRQPDADGYRARLELDVLENAPAFDAALPVSRREELSICGYYGTTPYWERQPAPPQAAT